MRETTRKLRRAELAEKLLSAHDSAPSTLTLVKEVEVPGVRAEAVQTGVDMQIGLESREQQVGQMLNIAFEEIEVRGEAAVAHRRSEGRGGICERCHRKNLRRPEAILPCGQRETSGSGTGTQLGSSSGAHLGTVVDPKLGTVLGPNWARLRTPLGHGCGPHLGTVADPTWARLWTPTGPSESLLGTVADPNVGTGRPVPRRP